MLDRKGEIRHDGGVVRDAPGLYRIGLNFLRRRKSSFIHGASDDATDLVDHLAGYLETAASDGPAAQPPRDGAPLASATNRHAAAAVPGVWHVVRTPLCGA